MLSLCFQPLDWFSSSDHLFLAVGLAYRLLSSTTLAFRGLNRTVVVKFRIL
ncbi:hypothetical protein HanIR_Chr08g0371781 [Helianthus annuus]|nr:hypothetical protein HanIR_Chr08g0371781 [Helianthus annuus]